MQLTIDSHGYLLGDGIQQLVSPFCDNRPMNTVVDLLVIHNISLPAGVFHNGFVSKLFTVGLSDHDHPLFESLNGLKVSAHVFISRSGLVTQFVPFSKRAWHAGVSEFKGRSSCNDFSIGIELEGTDTWVYTRNQYDSLLKLSRVLLSDYPQLTRDRVVGHSDIAPARKTDPGCAFDWEYFRGQLFS